MQAAQNIMVLNGYDVKNIVTGCPHCFNTIKNEYPELGGNYNVIHHTQFINNLIKDVESHVGITIITSLEGDSLFQRGYQLNALKEAQERVGIVIITGGLGPTVDDITVYTFLDYFDDEHEFDREYWSILKDRFKKLNFKMPNLSKSQAYKSKNCKMITNLVGTARGLHYTKDHSSLFKTVKTTLKGGPKKSHFFALPGVPQEMKSMMKHYVLPELKKDLKSKVVCKSIRTTGVPESILQEKISDIINNIDHKNLLGLILSCISPENFSKNLEEVKNLGIPLPDWFLCCSNKLS